MTLDHEKGFLEFLNSIRGQDTALINKLETILKEQGPEAALKLLEEELGETAPQGLCLCESISGEVELIGDRVQDLEQLDKFYEAVNKVVGYNSDLGESEARAVCSGKYHKKE